MASKHTVISERNPTGLLTVKAGPDAGVRFAIKHGTTIIGREMGVDIVLADKRCSRQHC